MYSLYNTFLTCFTIKLNLIKTNSIFYHKKDESHEKKNHDDSLHS